MHLLLIDDDAELCALLSEFLKREGFTVDCEHEGNRGLERAAQPGIDLVVLDVMLPGLDGFEILRRLRVHSKVPVIMLTARGEDVDRIIGLEIGADDYLAKPFNPRELAARIRAILRRYEARPVAPSSRIEVNGIVLDPASREVYSNGKLVEVTTFEFDILEMLMRSAGRVLSRDALMENFYNRKATPFDRSIDMHISHLRKKLDRGESIIKTIRGVGYQLARTPEDTARRMNSLFAKILLWFCCTVAITVVGSAFISALNVSQNVTDAEAPAARRMTFEMEEARAAYENGGRPALQAFIDNLQRIYGIQGILTDEKGRDLLNGQDRMDMIRQYRQPPVQFIRLLGDTTATRASEDGRYWFISIAPRPKVSSWFLTPEHIFWLAATLLLCYWLALHLTSPVRALQKAVERFGHGDLSARVNSARRDELGQLAGAFDQMAGRIETLLAAERRLLLDISHELRSPLARLGVAVELARSGDDTESALNRIQKESDRLNALVGQLLQVTRAEGDPDSLRRDPIRLDRLVQQMVDDSRIEASAHGCGLKYEPREAITVAGDPELLRRAVENVIRNAIRYSPRESDVEVRLARNNGKVVVDVRDRGPGVPEEALPRLFDAFYRVEPDRDRASGGIGLGLSIARRAIELHKGSIRAKNAKPGLEVEMELPVS